MERQRDGVMGIEEWRNKGWGGWRNGGTEEWRNGGMEEWRDKGMRPSIFFCLFLEPVTSFLRRILLKEFFSMRNKGPQQKTNRKVEGKMKFYVH
jgi:hypothetical protein